MKSRRILWIIPVACIFVVALTAVVTSFWIKRFLWSEDFRRLIASKTGEALAADVVYSPLRWAGSSLFSDSLQATGTPRSVVENLRADQVRADVNWRAIFHRVWRIDKIEVISFDGTFRPGSDEPGEAADTSGQAAVQGLASLLPTRFEVGEVDLAKAHIRFRGADRGEVAALRDSSLRVRPDGTGWTIEGTDGTLALLKLPALTVASFRSRLQGDNFFLTDAQCRLGETGRISASGEFARDSKLRLEWNQVDVAPFLDAAWQSRLSGVLAGDASLTWPESGLSAGKATGTFRLTEGLAQNLQLLDRVAIFTGAPQFRRMPLQEISGNFDWTREGVRITNLVAESKGLLRLEGNCTILAGGTVEGMFRIGVTPQTLQWLPGSRERVFTVAQSGYVWTDVKISGSLKDIREDLSSRLTAAMQDEAIHRGTEIIRELPGAATDGARDVFDALVPLIK
jgi:hypothetical protein